MMHNSLLVGEYENAREQLYRDINNLVERLVKEAEMSLIDPTPYVEQFRFLNGYEYNTLFTCAKRGRIPP